MIQEIKTLGELWDYIDTLNKQYFPENRLQPIHGGGKSFRPKLMFVFINPTHANISSDRSWQGPRFPFVGTKSIWRVFRKSGMLDDALMKDINSSKSWSVEFANHVLDFLKSKSFYFTNLVKWTGSDATLPDSKKIKLFLPLLEKEIEIVQPEYIISFGQIPSEKLTGQKIILGDYYNEIIKNKNIKFFSRRFGPFKTQIIPRYFPIGRGNPNRAIEILKLIRKI